jgi:hypothetical protein
MPSESTAEAQDPARRESAARFLGIHFLLDLPVTADKEFINGKRLQ